jgi:hypothetical protein
MGILQLLAKENYITYHKTLARVLGVDEAILFGELCSMSNLFGDEFFCEQGKLMDDTCLTEYRVRNALKNLQSAELVEIEKKGLPARNWYVLNEEKLLEIMELHRTSGVKFDTTGDGKNEGTTPTNSNTTINNNIINKNSSSKNKSNKKKERKNTSYDEILSRIEDASLKDLYYEYIKMRALIKAPMTDRALTMLIDKVNKLEPTDIERQKRLLETAIMNNWKSVYPLKDGKENTGDGQTNGDTPTPEYDPQLGSWY